MKILAALCLLCFAFAGCSSEPKYVQPTEKGTKAFGGAAGTAGQQRGVAPDGYR